MRVQTTIRFPSSLHKELKAAATDNGMTFNTMVMLACRDYLNKKETQYD